MKYVNIVGSVPITAIKDCCYPLLSKEEKTRQPYKCPVCSGKGFVPNGFYNCTGNTIMSVSTAPEQCKSCNGAGVIWHD